MTTLTETSVERHGLLIGDEWVMKTSAGVHDHIFPATGRVNARVALGGPDEIDRAVTAAAKAQKIWMRMTPDIRRELMTRLSVLVLQNAAEISRLCTADFGVTAGMGMVHPRNFARWIRYYAGQVDEVSGQIASAAESPESSESPEEPFGIVGLIVPWNGPIMSLGMMLAPALAAGNAVVVKPDELAPLASLRIGELALEAGLPPGLVNVVPGDDSTGDALVRHPGIARIVFTGSGATGRKIMRAASRNLTPVVTELEGQAANIVFADADLDVAVPLSAFIGPLMHSGQSYACGSRLFVQDAIYDQFVERTADFMSSMPAGDPFDPRTVVGPVISEAALNRILGVVDETLAKEQGELLTGGSRIRGALAGGYFFEPTLFADVDHGSRLFREVTSGPVVSVTRFGDEEEALALANETPYGLVNYIQTKDLRRAHRVAGRLESGSVHVDSDLVLGVPYGGFTQGGNGCPGGLEGLREFTRTEVVRIAMSPLALADRPGSTRISQPRLLPAC